jgi:hypothetical protein
VAAGEGHLELGSPGDARPAAERHEHERVHLQLAGTGVRAADEVQKERLRDVDERLVGEGRRRLLGGERGARQQAKDEEEQDQEPRRAQAVTEGR